MTGRDLKLFSSLAPANLFCLTRFSSRCALLAALAAGPALAQTGNPQ
jgi:hypothetical protein